MVYLYQMKGGPCFFTLHFLLAVALPFFHSFFIECSPYPMFNTMCLTLVSLPCALAISVLTTGWDSVIIRDPKVILNIVIAGICYMCTTYMTQFCYQISNLEAIVIFSLVPILFEEAVNMVFREEIPSTKGLSALGTMFLGFFLVIANFDWPVDKTAKDTQILALVVLSVCVCLQRISYRKLGLVAAEEKQVPSTVHTWIYAAASIPSIIGFFTFEGSSMSEIRKTWSSNYHTLIIFGVFANEIYRICDEVLPRMHGYGFATSSVGLRCLPVLLISVKYHHYTEYTPGQAFGIILLISGFVVYTFVTERPVVILDSDGDTLSLLSNEAGGLDNEHTFMNRETDNDYDEDEYDA